MPITQNHLDWFAARLSIAVFDTNIEHRRNQMSAIDRIKSKALQAKDIAPQAIRDFEADLDGIIAEKAGLAQRRAAAVAPHKEAISGIYSEIDGLKAAMDLLSNGGPPLEESTTAVTSSSPPSIVPDKPRIDTGEVEHLKLKN